MRIALVGSAPSSVDKAPFADQEWLIWGCSPGVYYRAPRVDLWFELHRWEPPVLGKPAQQKPWFSPEYCAWMAALRCPVYMANVVPEIPNSMELPWRDLVGKYGSYFFTSSLSWMAAMAIEAILTNRKLKLDGDERAKPGDDDWIGLWGVDMAANEEYGYQRAGCQFFAQLAQALGIQVYTPPESDLLIPPPLYGIGESNHRFIKWTARRDELTARKNQMEAEIARAQHLLHHLEGALDDLNYMQSMWGYEGEIEPTKYVEIFGGPINTQPL